MADDWQYTAKTLADALGITVAAVWQAVRVGTLPNRKRPIGAPPGNPMRLVFTEADLERYRREHLGRTGRPQLPPGTAEIRTRLEQAGGDDDAVESGWMF